MAPRVRVGTRLDPETERPRLLAWAEVHKRTEAESIRLLVMEALDAWDAARVGPVSAMLNAGLASAGHEDSRSTAELMVRRAARLREPHQFKPQSGNSLKCKVCGGRKGDHR